MTYPPTIPRTGRVSTLQVQRALADIIEVLGSAPQGTAASVQARIADAESAVGPVAAADLTDATAAGVALITAANAAAQRTAMGVPATSHTHTADDISDATTIGKTVAKAANAAAVRTAIGSTTVGDALFTAANLAAALAAIGEQRVRTSSSFNCSSNVTPVDVTGMAFTLAANKTYHFQVNFSTSASAATTTGIQVGFSLPASATMMAIADVPQAADGTAACFRGTLSSGTDYVVAASKNAASGAGVISGTIVTGANAGTAQMRILSEVNTSQVTIESGAVGWCKEVP